MTRHGGAPDPREGSGLGYWSDMNPRWLIAAVIVLVLVVGGAFLLIGLLRGDETDLEEQPVQGAAAPLVTGQHR